MLSQIVMMNLKRKKKNVIIINNGKTDNKPIIKKGPIGLFC